MGYGYVVAMVLVCGSALGIYGLTGRFGIFHAMALVSSATLLLGMLPLYLKKLPRHSKAVHLWFM